MLINEGLPLYLRLQLEASYDLGALTVGVLGMGFKPAVMTRGKVVL